MSIATKISDKEIWDMRRMFEQGMSLNDISIKTGAARSTIRSHITVAMWMRVKKPIPRNKSNCYTMQDEQYIKAHYKNDTSTEMAAALGKQPRNLANKVIRMRSQGKIGRKNHVNELEIGESRLSAQGERNKLELEAIKKNIKLSKYINLQIGEERERCVTVSMNSSSFLIKRRNYLESYNFSEVLMGKVKISV